MAKKNQKIILIAFFIASLILICGGFVLAESNLEIDYPTIPGADKPGPGTTLPQYIKYIFNFSLIIGGILAFGVMVLGGFLYLSSVGDPTAISDAKSRMFSGILGLVLLLCSYIILTTINPQLIIFGEMEPLEPVTGIYLINADDEKRYFAGSVPSIKDFSPISVEFISSPGELDSIFIYDEENYEGNIQRIPDTGVGDVVSVPFAESISFFWNRPGVYLYEKTKLEIDKRPPLYLSGSVASLGGDWNKKAKSVIIKHPSKQICKGAVFFTDPGFEGRCGDISVCWPPLWPAVVDFTTSVADLSIGDGSTYFSSIGNNEISSLHLYTVDTTKEYPGNVVFYDEINCKGNEILRTPKKGAWMENFVGEPWNDPDAKPGDTWDNRVLSFRINGEYKVILRTKALPPTNPPSEAHANLKCQGHWEMDETGCVTTIKGSTVYDPDPNNDDERPSSFQIIPAE